jgi:hypothetical protein
MRDNLPLSPLLPLQPDWPALAQECSRAYFALYRTIAAVRDGTADGHDYWQAYYRLEKAASTIAAWADPDLYGRVLARESILREAQPSPTAPLCPNAANNTPHADCCDTCRYELGI